jgi:prepilin-type N-terminal cleavage/methylation domain-containing protein
VKNHTQNQSGFTLIELMIALAILATLTVLVSQAISQAVKAKVKLQDQLDDVSRLRDGVRLIERDLNLAYHYRDVEKEINDLIKKKNSPGGGAPPAGGVPNGFTPPVQPDPAEALRQVPRRDPETHFVGTGDSVNFVTMNNARTVRNVRTADFAEVGYSLRDCKRVRGDGSSKCLWRRSTPYVDLDVTKGGDELVLMENVSEFKLRYIGKGKQDWTSDWRTDAQGDGNTKGRFPQAVEISITTERKVQGRAKKYSMQLIVPIHFPNNPEEGAGNASPTGP